MQTEVEGPAGTTLCADDRGDPQSHTVDHLRGVSVQPEGAAAEHARPGDGAQVDQHRRVDHQRPLGCTAGLAPGSALEFARESRPRSLSLSPLGAPPLLSRHSTIIRRHIAPGKCAKLCAREPADPYLRIANRGRKSVEQPPGGIGNVTDESVTAGENDPRPALFHGLADFRCQPLG